MVWFANWTENSFILLGYFKHFPLKKEKCHYVVSAGLHWHMDDDHDACGVMFILVGNRHGDPSSNPNAAVCISSSANTFRKDMNPTIFSPAMGKTVE